MQKLRIMLLLLVGSLVAGCNVFITPFDLSPDMATPVPSTPVVIVVTATHMPVRPTPVPVQPTTAATTTVKLFFIALNDNGRSGKAVGCGDSVVFRERDIPKTESVLRDTLTALFSAKQEYYGTSRLYNSLFRSNLQVVGISNHEGIFRVELSGQLVLTGVCEDARIQAQLMETIMQFSTVRQANVFVNGVALEKLLGGKGD
jgi:Sporulation and spore germination